MGTQNYSSTRHPSPKVGSNPRNPRVAYVRKGYSSTLRRLAMASLYHLKHSMSTAQLPLQHSIAGNLQSHIANRRRTEGSPGSAHQPCDSSKHACQLQATPGCEPRPEVNVMSWPYGGSCPIPTACKKCPFLVEGRLCVYRASDYKGTILRLPLRTPATGRLSGTKHPLLRGPSIVRANSRLAAIAGTSLSNA